MVTTLLSDLNTKAVDEQVRHGAGVANSLPDMANASDIVITCLPSPQASEAVMSGDQGVLANMASGSTWIEMSTTSVTEISRMGVLARSHGVDLLEAPLTGGVHRAAKGEMTVLAGGDESVFQRHRELLELLGGTVIYMGDLGSASLIKVITNLLCLVDLVAAGEALMLAKKGGLDLGKCYRLSVQARAPAGNLKTGRR